MRKILAVTFALLAALPAAALMSIPRAPAAATLLEDDGIEATIIRDAWGVPHVYADDARSLFYANGYAQAQDRLAQMEILRHVGKGRLAELTGPSGLALDLVARRELYTEEERWQSYLDLEPYWRAAFDGYRDGVNRWIGEVRADPTKLPAEYPALVVAPTDWNVTDTIAIAQYLLDVFGRGSGGQEVENAQMWAQLAEALGDREAAFDAFGDVHWVSIAAGSTYTTIKDTDGAPYAPLAAEVAHAYGGWPAAQDEATAAAEDAALVDDARADLGSASAAAGLPIRLGSNAQLLDSRFTASGQPILYGGPQMGYFAPMIPYELGLHGADFDVVGMGIAGAPGVIIGRAAGLSWTVTSGASDQVDTVAEKLVGYYHYEVDGQVRAMDCRNETHVVRPGPADMVPAADPAWRPPQPSLVTQEICRTLHGPVLYRTPDGAYAFASHRSYRGDEVRSGSLWLRIGTIQSLEDFEELFADFAFTFNFNFAVGGTPADPDGSIAYYHVGRQPLRDERLDPRLPRPGWDSSYEWQGFAHLAELPHVIDPASGYTVNWNNAPAAGWAAGDARELWGAIHRAELMDEELAPLLAAGDVTLDDVRAVNERASTREPFADDLYPLFHAAAVASGNAAAVSAAEAWSAAKFTYADGNGDGSHDHAAFRLYELWLERLVPLVFADELDTFTRVPTWDPPTSGDPHAADHGNHDHKYNTLIDAIAGTTAHTWCDVGPTDVTETCADRALSAMQQALAEDWASPLPTRQIKFVALGAEPAWQIDMVNRPSFQHFYDWGQPEGARSFNALPPGASGQMNGAEIVLVQANANGCTPCPLPPHMTDQLEMYAQFLDKPLLFTRAQVELHEESRVTL